MRVRRSFEASYLLSFETPGLNLIMKTYLIAELFNFLLRNGFVVAELPNLAVKLANFCHTEDLGHFVATIVLQCLLQIIKLIREI